MIRPRKRPLLIAMFVLLLDLSGGAKAARAFADGSDATLAERAVDILRQHCYRCHGREYKVEGYNILDRAVLLAGRGEDPPYLTPGKPDESELWLRFDEMPPKGARPSPEEREVILRWIEAKAPFPAATEPRVFIKELAVLDAIRNHLRGQDRADRPFIRYFTLTTLHNNPKVNDEELRLARAGVSKLVNSLSRKPTIVVPAVLGPDNVVMAVDLRKLGWDNTRVWSRILADYPYGLRFRNDRDPALRDLAL
jgi:mono/diheme cytochrome c family protein